MCLTIIDNCISWFASHIISYPIDNESKQMLDDIQLDTLFEVIKVIPKLNPFDLEVLYCNHLMILILYHLGLRSEELLNPKIENIDFANKRIKVIRKADKVSNSNIKESTVKTLERILPITDPLSIKLHNYIVNNRHNALSTIARRSGLSNLNISKRSDRADIKQYCNCAYSQMTDYEMVAIINVLIHQRFVFVLKLNF